MAGRTQLMKQIIYLLLLILSACGVKHSSVDYGKTKVSDLVAMKGPPVEEKAIPVSEGKMLIYEDDEKYQTKNDVVTHGFKEPKGDERSLLYWKHKLKDCDTVIKKISITEGHVAPEYEFKCLAEGVTVIYTEGSEFISRIIEHDKK